MATRIDEKISEQESSFSIPNGGECQNSCGDDVKTKSESLMVVNPTTVGEEEIKQNPRGLVVALKIAIISIVSILFLLISVVSKLSFLSLAEALQRFAMPFINGTVNFTAPVRKSAEDKELISMRSKVVTVYWQLLIVLIIPNLITFLRCLFFGFVGKARKNFPWPRTKAVVTGLIFATVEVVGVSFLAFQILASFSMGISILLLNGVFIGQIAVDVYETWRSHLTGHPTRHGYTSMESRYRRLESSEEGQALIDDSKANNTSAAITKVTSCLDHHMTTAIALVCQIFGLLGCIVLWSVNHKDRLTDTKHLYILSFLLLLIFICFISASWTNKFQTFTTKTVVGNKSSRYKASLINCTWKLFLYPFVSYIVFRCLPPFFGKIDPWCIHQSCEIDISGPTLNLMILHIASSLVGYLVAWIAGTMALIKFILAISFFSTPISIAVYVIVEKFTVEESVWFAFYMKESDNKVFTELGLAALLVAVLIWVGGAISMISFILKKSSNILAKDQDMFLTPHYDSIFLEQQIVLNSQEKSKYGTKLSTVNTHERRPRTIFICSTMYRENAIEMKQMLVSIGRVAKHYATKKMEDDKKCDKFESHIFFDGAITGSQVENFGLQLLSLLEEALGINLKEGTKTETPYGYTFSWTIGNMIEKIMPFTIHFKDKTKVKPKKRWSQVMYMNYVLKYRIKNDPLADPDNTYILTTDADIDFTADSAIALLDMMDCDDKVAAVSARTHPKGHGLIYWYQLFDYAIGHWFQKPAEHILGSVLCSPGCFSVFRCSALAKVLEEYSTEVNNAMEFLMKDMGEDRWLCTLLIKEGYRLDYCALSEDNTYCPTEFEEFYKQRRRWIPSTVANLITLVTEYRSITKNNDSITILFILFQWIMIFSIAIAPATVVLVISAGLESFNIPAGISIAIFFVIGVLYGLVCLYASPKAQLDVAKVLTFFFSVIMALVVIGIFKEVIEEITGTPKQKLIGPGDCSGFMQNGTEEEYIQCMRSREYALNSNNSIANRFTLPVTPTIMYIGALAVTFFVAALVHYKEKHCLIHSIWFLLALPSGYLLLLIYSTANLCDRTWGTREQSTGEDEGIWGWKKYLMKAWNFLVISRCFLWCHGGGLGSDDHRANIEQERGRKDEEVGNKHSQDQNLIEFIEMSTGGKSEELYEAAEDSNRPSVSHPGLNEDAIKWLTDEKRECKIYVDNFERNGYTTCYFIASVTEIDLEAIGIDKAGFRHRLMREIKELEKLPNAMFDFPSKEQTAVGDWLKQLELGEYKELFHYEGYRTSRDKPALALLGRDELQTMGIHKRAHLQRLTKAIEHLTVPPVSEAEMTDDVREWLKGQDCECYVDSFTNQGYTSKTFLSGIKDKELQEIGVEKRGLRRRLQKAAQRLPSLCINTEIPESVEAWLQNLELEEYKELFHEAGYKSMDDMENLKELSLEELQSMGIQKRAHLNRLKAALNFLAKPSQVDIKKRNTKSIIDGIPSLTLKNLERTQFDFWNKLIQKRLKPVAVQFTPIKDVHKSLENLRNFTMAVLLLINLIWIVLLGSLTFWQLQQYGIDPRAFQLLYLSVYGFIIIIQFIAMLAHRVWTLIHYLGRVNPEKPYVEPEDVNIRGVK